MRGMKLKENLSSPRFAGWSTIRWGVAGTTIDRERFQLPSAANTTAPKPRIAAADAPPRQSSTIAMVQMAPYLGDVRRNLDAHLARIEQARAAGADLIVFPELSLTGYFVRDMVPEVALRLDSPELRELIEAAGACDLIFGMVEDDTHDRFHITGVYVESGAIRHVHRKVYLPTYGLFDEKRYFAAGHRIEAFNTSRFGRVGLLICEDLWHLSAVAVMQAEKVDLLVAIANSPARGVDGPCIRTAETYRRMCRTYAEMLGAMVVFVNRVGFEDGLCFWGQSMAIGPDSLPLTEAPALDEALVLTTFDKADLRRRRVLTPLARDENLLLTIEELQRIKRSRYESESSS